MLFYDSIIPVFLSLIFLRIYFQFLRKQLILRQQKKLLLEFKEWLFSLNSSLSSGYALENAITESMLELETLFGSKSFIYNEVALIRNKLHLNIPIADALNDFSLRSGLSDIHTFSQIISIAKTSGGNMITLIRNSSETIGEKIALQNQIQTMVSSSKYQLIIMAILPLVIIKYVDFTQPGFFEPLYHNLFGVTVMTVCLLIYFAGLMIANNILKFTRRLM